MGEIEFITFYPLHHQHLTDQFHTSDNDKHMSWGMKDAFLQLFISPLYVSSSLHLKLDSLNLSCTLQAC